MDLACNMHIGLIGGIGPAAASFYYRGLADRFAAAGKVMDLTMVHADAGQLVSNMAAGIAQAQAEIFATFTQRLKAAGADAVAVTSMGGHFCISEFEAISPLPVLNVIPSLNAEFIRRDLKRVGLLGTRNVMESAIYSVVLSVETVVPLGDDFAAVHENYIAMATAAKVTAAQRDVFFRVGRDLVEKQNSDVVLLAGTDLFLAFEEQDCGFPVLDAAEIHMDAIFDWAVAA